MPSPLIVYLVLAFLLAAARTAAALPPIQSVVVTVSPNDSGPATSVTLSVSNPATPRTWTASEAHALSVRLVPNPDVTPQLGVSMFLSPSSASNNAAFPPTELTIARTGNILRARLNDMCLAQGSYSLYLTAASTMADAVVVPLGTMEWLSTRDLCRVGLDAQAITHQFRQDHHPPKIVLSSLFLVLVTLPCWMLVVPMWSLVASTMPARVTLLNTLFVASVFAFAGLAIAYWTVLNLLQTLPIAIVAGLGITPLAIHALQEHLLW